MGYQGMVVLTIAFGLFFGVIGTAILLCSLKVGGDYEEVANQSAKEGNEWNS